MSPAATFVHLFLTPQENRDIDRPPVLKARCLGTDKSALKSMEQFFEWIGFSPYCVCSPTLTGISRVEYLHTEDL